LQRRIPPCHRLPLASTLAPPLSTSFFAAVFLRIFPLGMLFDPFLLRIRLWRDLKSRQAENLARVSHSDGLRLVYDLMV